MFRLVSLLLVLAAVAVVTNAQGTGQVPGGPKNLPAVKLSTAPVINGTVADGEWPSEGRGEGFFDKDTFQPSDEFAEYWLAYDDKYVYFAARAKTNPKTIVADEYRQNVNLEGNDIFVLALDAPASGQDIDVFSMNAQGATSLRLSGGRAAKTEWLGEFDCVGRITETGWEVEAKLPWTLITVPSAGKKDIVFNVLWFRSNQSNTFEWVITKEDFKNFPRWTGVEIPAVPKDRSLKMLPYFYAGIDDDGRHIANAGLDMKTEFGNMTMVGTANPDFRNIENNILSLDHSYFERLADDARPFFQEGSRYRNFGFDQRVYATQRIADFDFGLNFYGRISSKTQLGMISTVDVGNQTTVATSIGHRFDASKTLDFSYARNEQKGLQNDAVNVFYDQRVGDLDYYVSFQGTNDQVAKSGSRINGGVFKQSGGRNMSIEFVQVTPDFSPRLGFSPEQNLRGFNGSYGVQTQPKKGPIREQSIELSGHHYSHFDGSEYRRGVQLEGEFSFHSDWGLGIAAEMSRFEGSDDHLVSFGIGRPLSNPYRRVELEVTYGKFEGKAYRAFGFEANYRPVQRMQLAFRSQFVDHGPFERQLILSANYDIGKFEALGGRLVNMEDKWNWYLSYRMSGKRGNEFFVILGDPNATEFRKTLILKAVIPVSIRF